MTESLHSFIGGSSSYVVDELVAIDAGDVDETTAVYAGKFKGFTSIGSMVLRDSSDTIPKISSNTAFGISLQSGIETSVIAYPGLCSGEVVGNWSLRELVSS